jgi:hypothetical protein
MTETTNADLPGLRGPAVASLRSGPVEDAFADLAGVFGDSVTAVDVGGHETCTEADAIARALWRP